MTNVLLLDVLCSNIIGIIDHITRVGRIDERMIGVLNFHVLELDEIDLARVWQLWQVCLVLDCFFEWRVRFVEYDSILTRQLLKEVFAKQILFIVF